MCGIAGLVVADPRHAEQVLSVMIAAQLHRGPDDEGRELVRLADNRWLGLGHRRLSIIDLSPAGHQPMVHPQTGDILIYNGELYNFQALRDELAAQGAQFRGHSDTEVLLHALSAYGPACLDRLAGMFALAFFRKADHTLLLARDPLGIKPLYVGQGSEGLVFASEVRAIRASGLVNDQVDERAVAGLLAYGSVQKPHTICRGIRSFPPGAYLEIAIDRPEPIRWERVVRYWRVPEPRHNVSTAEAVVELSQTLDLAVKQHLISDVPIGVFLSSGLDSTIVTGLAAHHTSHLRTFTIGFADQPDMSESDLATATARELEVEHVDIQITGADAEQAAVRWLAALDQPSLDGLNTYIISQATREEGIIVALSGLGGDELFGGYATFAELPRIQRLLQRIRWIPPEVRAQMFSLAGRLRSKAIADKAGAIGRSSGNLLDLCLQRRRVMPDSMLEDLGLDARRLGLHPGYVPHEAVERLRILDDDPVWTISELESLFYMTNTLLRDSDANGMAHSLEIRVPLLDRRVIDLAFGLPGNVRLPDGQADKRLLRAAFARFLRPALTQQKKRGFTLPVRRWMLGPLRPLCEQAFKNVRESGLLRPQAVDAIWQAFLAAPETTAWSRAFTIVTLGTYLQQPAARPLASVT